MHMFDALELTIDVPPYVLRPGGLEGRARHPLLRRHRFGNHSPFQTS